MPASVVASPLQQPAIAGPRPAQRRPSCAAAAARAPCRQRRLAVRPQAVGQGELHGSPPPLRCRRRSPAADLPPPRDLAGRANWACLGAQAGSRLHSNKMPYSGALSPCPATAAAALQTCRRRSRARGSSRSCGRRSRSLWARTRWWRSSRWAEADRERWSQGGAARSGLAVSPCCRSHFEPCLSLLPLAPLPPNRAGHQAVPAVRLLQHRGPDPQLHGCALRDRQRARGRPAALGWVVHAQASTSPACCC